jgi:hypothetical protein
VIVIRRPTKRCACICEQGYYVPADENGDYKIHSKAGDDYADALDAMRTLALTYVVLIGAVGAFTGDRAFQAQVGTRRLIIPNP